MLERAVADLQNEGVPGRELPVEIASFLIHATLECGDPRLAEFCAEGAIAQMREGLSKWREARGSSEGKEALVPDFGVDELADPRTRELVASALRAAEQFRNALLAALNGVSAEELVDLRGRQLALASYVVDTLSHYLDDGRDARGVIH